MQGCPAHSCSSRRVSGRISSIFSAFANSNGFNLVELMVVVAIVGILASVAVPLYMGYIQKSRFKALVYPGLHIIETNIGLYYAMNNTLPDASLLPAIMAEADTTYFNVGLPGGALVITIDSPVSDSKLSRLHGLSMAMIPNASNNKIGSWELTGALANKLGINTK